MTSSSRYVFFWHECKDGVIGKGCLSQWQACSFSVRGTQYSSAEQFMMAEKARVFGDNETRKEILSTDSPKVIKALGRKVRGFDGEKWNAVKCDIVVRGNTAKFSQNPELLAFLIGTGDATLVEASPYDCIWGVGLREADKSILNPAQWKGENLLGKALMKVREELARKKNAKAAVKEYSRVFGAGQRAVRKVKVEMPVPKVSETRRSIVVGLGTNDSEKWRLFLNGGPYWNYLIAFLLSKSCFSRHADMVEDAVNTSISKVARFMATGKFVYKEEGKGYFRAFLKMVTARTAMDLLKKEEKHEIMPQIVEQVEQVEMQLLNGKITNAKLSRRNEDEDIWDDVDTDSKDDTSVLDAYDKENLLNSEGGSNSEKKGSGAKRSARHHLVRFEDIKTFSDDEEAVGEDAAALLKWRCSTSDAEFNALRKCQLHIFYIALGFVLADRAMPVLQRKILHLLYIERWKPMKIWALEDFSLLKRDAFDQRLYNAKMKLRSKILEMWRLVAPDGANADDRQLLMLWAQLSNQRMPRRIVQSLRKRVEDASGGF